MYLHSGEYQDPRALQRKVKIEKFFGGANHKQTAEEAALGVSNEELTFRQKHGDHRREPMVITEVPQEFVDEIKTAQAEAKVEEDKKKSTLIVSPWLEYKEDRTFYEEMDRKHGQIKSIISEFFSARTMDELQAMGDETMKMELTGKINEILVMGKIDKILFNDFQFLVE